MRGPPPPTLNSPYNQDHKRQCCQEPEPEIWRRWNTRMHECFGLRGIEIRGAGLGHTRVRHVFELRAGSDHQENQVEDVEHHDNQEEHLHALENTAPNINTQYKNI